MFLACQLCALLTIFSTFVFADDDKYEMFVDKLEIVKGTEFLAATGLKIDKTGSTNFVFNGNIEHFKQFDDEWTIALKISKSDTADGDYRSFIDYPLQGKRGICSFLKNEYKKFFYDSVKECSTAPNYDTCPLKEAKYSFNKCSFDAGVFKKYLGKGYYIMTVFLSHLEENNLVEYRLYTHIEGSQDN